MWSRYTAATFITNITMAIQLSLVRHVYGLIRSKPFLKNKRLFMIKYLEFRGAFYSRNTGLNAFITSLNVGFSIR